MIGSILIVDDNPMTRKLVRFALEKRNYQVIEAADGTTALRLVEQKKFDLVLQDLVLPDVDGFELVALLRQKLATPHIPILAFSGFVSKLEEARISAVGFDDVITKPIEPSRLIQIVEAHLYRPEALAHPTARFGAGRKLVVADDDPMQAKLFAFRLSRLGFDVVLASDGAAALAAARSHGPAAIVSDVMMPGVDGFRLCIEARREEALERLPIILMTSSYIDEADRRLAEQAGATAYVLRTPDLREVVEVLRRVFLEPEITVPPVAIDPAELEREHSRRVVQQLERQVLMNAGIAQRCTLLSAELSILSGISSALTQHEDFDVALDGVLAAFFDAGGISTGALYLLRDEGVRVRSLGMASTWDEGSIRSFFGDLEELRSSLSPEAVIVLPSANSLSRVSSALRAGGVRSAIVVPLAYRGRLLGGLFLASTTVQLAEEDRLQFVSAVAAQIAQAIALAESFAARIASERAARETAATLRAIMESAADGIAVADESGRFTYWNSAAASMLQRGPAEKPPDEWASHYGLFLPDRSTPYPTNELPMVRAMRGEQVEQVEIFVRHPGIPEGVWLSTNARPLLDADGNRRGGVTVFHDVTAEKAAQEQLMVSDRMASVGMLAAGVAHEINNPMAAVLANVELALRDVRLVIERHGEDATILELQEELMDAREASERVRQIVRDLKIFSRAEEDRRTRVNVHQVLDSSLRMAWNEIRHRARLIKDYREVSAVEISESRLGQVFLNLIINATQAISEGKVGDNEIRVSSRMDSSRVIVEIEDTGTGIPPELLPKLFSPFVTTKPAGVGTGLGLAICRRIITSAGGEISVESQLGKGTVFRVSLPVAQGEEERTISVARVIAPARRGRVLVIDDEPTVLRVVARTLNREHDVTTTTVAKEALDRMVAGEQFDVILCDLMMPNMTGMELHAALLELVPDQAERLVFFTGGAFSPRAQDFLNRVSNPRIEKPFDPTSLRAAVSGSMR